ncbi:transporter [Lithospermum erythrorhizon]|uniref:Transporter n=1 Tax=Lithospermum erythrorhizon TaxID=34254 RepID=A0AAV3RJ28_LITER
MEDIMKHNNNEEASNELETILSNELVPMSKRLRFATWIIELKLLVKLAAPAVVVYMINFVMSMSTQIFSGHLVCVYCEKCKRTWGGLSLQAFSGLPEFFKLSATSAVMLCLEAWYFQIIVLLAGLLPNPELALDALSIW